MVSSEFNDVRIWYLFFVALGWGTFPLSYTIFRHFPDRGFALAKTVGLFVLSYLIWFSTSLGITSYTQSTILRFGLLFLLINVLLLILQFQEIMIWIRKHFLLLLLIEAIFVGFFAACVIVRMYNPELTGAEKEADFTFLNAILTSKTFPPKDTWFAGGSINYYYFGYLIWATVIKLTGIISPIGFNLALAATVALSAVGIWAIVYALTQRISYSTLSSFLLLVFGNLDGLVQVVERGGKLLPFDWWRSSRVIPDTINEFPFFSFLLGDLHAHFMSIPFALLLIGLLGQWIASSSTSSETSPLLRREKFSILNGKGYQGLLLVLIALSLGGGALINAWDYPTYVILTGCCLGLLAWKGFGPSLFGQRKLGYVLTGSCLFAALILLSRLLFQPFYQHFIPQLSPTSLRVVASAQRTELKYFLVIYGGFLWIILLFGVSRLQELLAFLNKQERVPQVVFWNGVALLLVLSYLFLNTWVIPLSCLVCAMFLYLLVKELFFTRQRVTDNEFQSSIFNLQSSLPSLLVFMAFAIIAGCEIFYIKDFYGHPLERQNTIFKFHYQAWIFLSIGTPYLLYRVSQRNLEARQRYLKYGRNVMFVLFCGACCIYPVVATYEKAYHFKGRNQGGLLYLPTLNGISYISHRDPYEYQALRWIQEHTDENSVILEATGKAYSFFGRVASTTGRSTVLGWGNHEALWRGQRWDDVMQRTEEIKQIYETIDKILIVEILEKYGIEYVYVGKLEKESYSSEGLKAFGDYFPVVFENPFVTIYKRS